MFYCILQLGFIFNLTLLIQHMNEYYLETWIGIYVSTGTGWWPVLLQWTPITLCHLSQHLELASVHNINTSIVNMNPAQLARPSCHPTHQFVSDDVRHPQSQLSCTKQIVDHRATECLEHKNDTTCYTVTTWSGDKLKETPKNVHTPGSCLHEC